MVRSISARLDPKSLTVLRPTAFKRALAGADIVLDCVFGVCSRFPAMRGFDAPVPPGFSFKGPARAPFSDVLAEFQSTSKPILSVDIPSGWDVEKGNIDGLFTPSRLLSLAKCGIADSPLQLR